MGGTEPHRHDRFPPLEKENSMSITTIILIVLLLMGVL